MFDCRTVQTDGFMKQVFIIKLLLYMLTGSFAMAVLPAPWQNQDIGSVAVAGSADYSDSVFTVNGSGADVWGNSDEFHYVCQSYTGDVQIIAQIISQTNTDEWAKAGLMIRETLGSNSKHAMIIVTPENGTSFQYRTETDGVSYAGSSNAVMVPCWLKLIRSGNEFKAYSSIDSIVWILNGSTTISMNSTVYVGLCVTSHNDSFVSTAEYQDVSITTDSTCPTPDPAAWQQVPQATGPDTVEMIAETGDDASTPIEYYFEEITGNTGGSDSGWQFSPIYTDYGLEPMQTYTYVVRMRDAFGNMTSDAVSASVLTGPTPDVDDSEIVDFVDFASFSANWMDVDCDLNAWCNGSDFDLSGDVGTPDLLELCLAWLGKVELGNFYNWAQTPPMGWNSYDCYGCAVYEYQARENAEYMATYLKQYGWEYIVLDSSWYTPEFGIALVPNQDENFQPHSSLDEYGRLLPDPDRFPSSAGGEGFKPFADYLHSLGLKFGIHLMRGIPREVVALDLPVKGTSYTASDIANTSSTCPWYNLTYGLNMNHPAAQAYLDSMFELYASWGVDLVKVDDLSASSQSPYYHTSEIEGYRKAIDACGRPMILSTSPGPTPITQAQHISANANMWRLLNDLWDNWNSLDLSFDKAVQWQDYIGDGHWPDLDMLPMGVLSKYGPVGDERYSNLTHDEIYTMMTLWCIARSPLMFGGNLPENDAFTTAAITNAEVIAVNQNSENNRMIQGSEYPIWAADVSDSNDIYLAVFNRTSSGPTAVSVVLNRIGVKRCAIRDLWTHTELGEYQDLFTPNVNAHGANLYRLTVLETTPVPEIEYVVTLLNAGFDSQSLSEGGWSGAGDVTSWNDDSGGWSHTQNLTTDDIDPPSQSSSNVGILSQGAWIGQNLKYDDGMTSVPIEVGKTYEITVWIGRRNNTEGTAAGILKVYLEDTGSNTRIDEDTFDLISLSQGSWTQQTFILSTGSSPTGLGNQLRLGFINEGDRGAEYWYGQVVLDDVTFNEL